MSRFLPALCGAAFLATFAAGAVSYPALAARHAHVSAASRALRQERLAARSAQAETQDQALRSGSVVIAARAFQGTRYVFGGTSRSGFDCSGFTRFILGSSAGVALPRTALEQYYNGMSVPKEQLLPGDLVFFKNTYKPGVSHVGIYIGNGQFIHACNERRGVTTDSLSEPFYVAHYAGARRVMVDYDANQR